MKCEHWQRHPVNSLNIFFDCLQEVDTEGHSDHVLQPVLEKIGSILKHSPLSLFFLDLGHKEEGTFYLNDQVVRKGRKSCLINNDLLIQRPHVIVISSVKV